MRVGSRRVREICRELPTPLAHLVLRTQNDSAPERQHHNAYYTFELWMRLAAAAAAAIHAKSGKKVEAVQQGVAQMRQPSCGHLTGLVRAFTQTMPEDPIAEFWHAPIEDDTRPGLEWALEHTSKETARKKSTYSTFADALVAYRNRTIGHGAMPDTEFYARGAEALFGSVLDFVRRGSASLGKRLLAIDEVSEQSDGRRIAVPLELVGSDHARDPELLLDDAQLGKDYRRGYLYMERDDGTLLRLSPWLIWSGNCVQALSRTSQKRAEYLNYNTGETVQVAHLQDAIRRACECGDLALPAHLEEHRGKDWIGGYRVESELGRGGMGKVLRARQASLDMPVALKILPPELAKDETARARFRHEVEILKRCEHPHIVSVLDAGETEDVLFYAMEIIEGCTLSVVYSAFTDLPAERKSDLLLKDLAAVVKANVSSSAAPGESFPPPPFPSPPHGTPSGRGSGGGAPVATDLAWRALLLRFAEVADALGHLHSKGVIHRDIKPSNIMLSRGATCATVMDLGIARAEQETMHTRTGAFLGTLRYASCEQVMRKLEELDFRADLYSLGATMYELFTLSPVFGDDEKAATGMNEAALLRKVMHERPAPARERNPALPRELEIVLEKLLEKEPDRRLYSSAAELAEDLRAIYYQRPIRAREYTAEERRAHEVYDSLRAQADSWHREQRTESLLWHEDRVTELRRLDVAGVFKLSEAEQAFVDASCELANRERTSRETDAEDRRRMQRRLRLLRRGLVGLLVAGLTVLATTMGLAYRETQISLARTKASFAATEDALNEARAERSKAQRSLASSRLLEGKAAESKRMWDHASAYYAAALAGDRSLLDAKGGLQREAVTRLRARATWTARPGSVAAALALGGGFVAVAADQGKARLVSMRDCNKPPVVLDTEAKSRLLSIAVSWRGRRVAAGTDTGDVYVWNVQTRRLVASREALHERGITALHFEDDGILITAGVDGQVKRWRVLGQKPPEILSKDLGALRAMAFGRSGSTGYLAVAGDEGVVRLLALDGETRPIISPALGESVLALAVVPIQEGDDTRQHPRIVVGTYEDAIHEWDPDQNSLAKASETHDGDVYSLAVSEDGRMLLSGSEDGTALIWERSNPWFPVRRLASSGDEVVDVAFSPDSDTTFVLAEANGTVDAFEFEETGPSPALESPLLGHGGGAEFLAFSPGNAWLASSGGDGIRVWPTSIDRPRRPDPWPREATVPAAVAFLDDDRVVYGDENRLVVRALSPGRKDAEVAIPRGEIFSVAVGSTGAVAFGTEDGQLGIWEPGAKGRPRLWRAHTDRVSCVRFSQDGARLVSAGGDQTIRVWNWLEGTGLPGQPLMRHDGEITDLAFSKDGQWLASAGLDRRVRIWRVSDWSEVRSLEHPERVWELAFSPKDPTRLASACKDGKLRIWNVRSGKLEREVAAHRAPAYAVEFSADGALLASACEDSTIRVWRTEDWREVGARDMTRLPSLLDIQSRTGLCLRPDRVERRVPSVGACILPTTPCD